MEINGVKMIPSSLVNCLVDGKEVRIMELAVKAVQIRTASRLDQYKNLQMNFFVFTESQYEEIQLEQFRMIEEIEESFYYVYTFEVEDKAYQSNVNRIIQSYTKYIQLKMTGDDSYCSEEMVGYPANLDEEFAKTFEEQKKDWFENLALSKVDYSGYEFAVGIDCPSQYQKYLQYGIHDYMKQELKDNFLHHHPIAHIKVQRVYLGNQFCHNLLPDRKTLFAMMEQALGEGLSITVVTTYLREEQILEASQLLEELYVWCQKTQVSIELIVNDWGMAKLLKGKSDQIQPTLGVLLNKRRKDPRYVYKGGFTQYMDQLAKNNLDAPFYRELIDKEFGMKRYEYETCGYPIHLPSANHSLHIPYYQTNTSQYCTLYAKCVEKERGKQKLVRHCPRYCEGLVFTYPKHLKMVGRYNSLFGMDPTMLCNEQQVKEYRENGIDRIVLTLF